MADLGSAEGGRFLEGAYGCAVSRGGVRRVRPMVVTSLSGPVLSFYGPWGWGGGGRGLWHPHTPRKLRLGNRLYDLCAFGARLSHFPFKFTALGVINEGVGASWSLWRGGGRPPPPPLNPPLIPGGWSRNSGGGGAGADPGTLEGGGAGADPGTLEGGGGAGADPGTLEGGGGGSGSSKGRSVGIFKLTSKISLSKWGLG